MDLVPKKETATKVLVDDDRETTGEPILADLGIVYAHGNEDIVNFGAGNQENAKQNTGLKDTDDSAIPPYSVDEKIRCGRRNGEGFLIHCIEHAISVKDEIQARQWYKPIMDPTQSMQFQQTIPGLRILQRCGRKKEKVKLGASARQQKRSQYSLLAQSMGMEEVEFSKWLLSATPVAERKSALRV
ncbi:unnamed protein product [Fraxinus pennsylvanica]|uniref:Uncharacterized protein n=1 Tax=Fraxinus pennsylvanica TaxID=56036 RepID=A0AAD1ZP03_9LAMI|nr:unnamed protein product [Fraxinus pennsylvanica]